MTTEPRPASRRADLLTVLGVAAVVLVADQASKAWVAANIAYQTGRIEVVGDLVQLWNVRNTGAAFSLLEGGLFLFVIVTVVALGMIVYFFRAFAGRSPWLFVILGAILGGALGNFVDRLRFGYVTDFLSVGFGDTRWPTFNVADSAVVTGIGLLVIILTFFTPDEAGRTDTTRTEMTT